MTKRIVINPLTRISGFTTDKIIKMKSILKQIEDFIINCMIPDVQELARYYKEYFELGKGYGNLLSYGYHQRCFGALVEN